VARHVRRDDDTASEGVQRLGEREREVEEAAGGGALGHPRVKDGAAGKVVTPQAKREAVLEMVVGCQRSERRACALVGISRDGYRNPVPPSALNAGLSAEITELAQARRRAGYRMIHDLLRPSYAAKGVAINAKRAHRLYREAGLAVRKRRRAKKAGLRVPLVQASMANETWSMDFVFDSLANGRSLKCLTVTDDFTRESVLIGVAFGINGQYVTTLPQARADIALWGKDYNEVRPHSSCGKIPPASFAAQQTSPTQGMSP
jgi:putative transposase